MAVILRLTTDPKGQVSAMLDGEALATTALADLPRLPPPPTREDERPPPTPLMLDPEYEGRPLYVALGDNRLRQALEDDPDGVLLLDADERASVVPWEFAALPDGGFLACEYGLLRLIEGRDAPPPPQDGPLQLLALAADPLVDASGNVRDGHRLDVTTELAAIRSVVEASGAAVEARRIPPTRDGLIAGLARGPAILHLTCHGGVTQTYEGPQAVLSLEDDDGKEAALAGPELRRIGPRGVLRLAVLSACRTDAVEAGEAGLARLLVRGGLPAAVGMQASFPDPASADFAATLYRFLLAGHTLAEAVRLARVMLQGGQRLYTVGLPVGYVRGDGWRGPKVTRGVPHDEGLMRLGEVRWPARMEPPRTLFGRNADLYRLALCFTKGHSVVTVAALFGQGKTALVATFVERFGWRWSGGVAGVSFVDEPVDVGRVVRELLDGQTETADRTVKQLEQDLLAWVRKRDRLLVFDNYESVLAGCDAKDRAADAVHRLARQLVDAGATLLLTSQHWPAGLPHEKVYPDEGRLTGLHARPGSDLFLHHSERAQREQAIGEALAQRVTEETDGHAQAIILLAEQYDHSGLNPDDFLERWPDILAMAKQPNLPEHQKTLWMALQRNAKLLPQPLEFHFLQLASLDKPFGPVDAARAWGLSLDNVGLETTLRYLCHLTQHNWLQAVEYVVGDSESRRYTIHPLLERACLDSMRSRQVRPV